MAQLHLRAVARCVGGRPRARTHPRRRQRGVPSRRGGGWADSLAGLAEVTATGRTKVIHELPGRWVRDTKKVDGFVAVIWQALPGTDSGIIIWGLDVTEQVRAREGFAELSAEQLALFDLVPSAIVAVDRHGAVRKTVSTSRRNDGPRSLPGRGLAGARTRGRARSRSTHPAFPTGPKPRRAGAIRCDAALRGGRRDPRRRGRGHRDRRAAGPSLSGRPTERRHARRSRPAFRDRKVSSLWKH